jgi:hypothetical protein
MAMRCVLIVLLAVSAMPLTAWGAARPYSVRDIAVGVSLSQFRSLPHPDAETRSTARLYCSNEPGAGGLEGLTLAPRLLQADALKCAFYQPALAAEGEQLVAAPMNFLGEEITPLFLFFRPEGAADYGLAQITFAMSNRRGAELIGLFYRAFGGVTSLDVIGVSTSFGGNMPNIRYIWRNDLSTIQLDSLSFVLTEMSIAFLDNKLWGNLSDRLTTIERMSRIANQEEQRLRSETERAKTDDKPSVDPPVLSPDTPESAQ